MVRSSPGNSDLNHRSLSFPSSSGAGDRARLTSSSPAVLVNISFGIDMRKFTA